MSMSRLSATKCCLEGRYISHAQGGQTDAIDQLGKAVYITTLDRTRLLAGTYGKGSKSKTAFITPLGLYQFCVMPFELSATFQRMADKLVWKGTLLLTWTIWWCTVHRGKSTLSIFSRFSLVSEKQGSRLSLLSANLLTLQVAKPTGARSVLTLTSVITALVSNKLIVVNTYAQVFNNKLRVNCHCTLIPKTDHLQYQYKVRLQFCPKHPQTN